MRVHGNVLFGGVLIQSCVGRYKRHYEDRNVPEIREANPDMRFATNACS